MQLIQYSPTTEQVRKRPLLIVPPWINKYYILDLRREELASSSGRSDQGHTSSSVSWVNPDEELAGKSFEDYMAEGTLAALDQIQLATGETEINAIGYCLGGTLLASTLAYMAAKGDERITSATFFTTMTDFSEAGELSVFIDEEQLQMLEEKMDEKGYLDGSTMATTFNMLRANDLIWSFVVNNYLLGKDPFPFDLLYWNSDSTRMPARDAQLLSAQHVSKEPAGSAGRNHAEGPADRPAADQDTDLHAVHPRGPYRSVEIDLCRHADLQWSDEVRPVGVRPHRRRGQSSRR